MVANMTLVVEKERAIEKGWRTPRNFFPYGDTDVSSQQAKAACAGMRLNLYDARKEAHNNG